ncbi:MAG: metal-dependent transcriptional regulator [Thermoplasmata archaeon]|nr:metal-dependent transcriptional regulator [Thermoplasmata archaeon]
MRRITKEEYIETIDVLERKDGRAQTGQIAEMMDVKPPSVTEMLQKLQGEGLVDYEPYLGASLTPAGIRLAAELTARHKVIADFLEIIGVERELAEQDACQIEHHVSKVTAERLQEFVRFVQEAPRDPKWIEHFKTYCETGEREECQEEGRK